MDLKLVGDDDLCVMCAEERVGRERGKMLVLNIEERRERREYLTAKYAAEGTDGGPSCRSCGQLPTALSVKA